MDNEDYLADQLLQGNVGAVGSIGAVDVRRRVVGAPAVQARYVGAPVEHVPQSLPEEPIKYSPATYVAGDVTLLGLGETTVPAGGEAPVTIRPLRPFTPQKLGCPSNVQNLLMTKASIGGTNIFANSDGVPIELLSEVSTFPQIDWPTLDPAVGIEFTLRNNTGGPLPFKGALYGTAVRR